jgi:inorganic pyrophosphatase/exopolyphosphatase
MKNIRRETPIFMVCPIHRNEARVYVRRNPKKTGTVIRTSLSTKADRPQIVFVEWDDEPGKIDGVSHTKIWQIVDHS